MTDLETARLIVEQEGGLTKVAEDRIKKATGKPVGEITSATSVTDTSAVSRVDSFIDRRRG